MARAELPQHPRQRPEVVLVAVGDDDRLDVVGALAQVGEVGQHEVDPDHLRGREAQADVDDDDPPVVLDDGHVLADLPEPPEGQDAQVELTREHGWRGLEPTSPWRSSIAADLLLLRLASPPRAAGAARRRRGRACSARPSCTSGWTVMKSAS